MTLKNAQRRFNYLGYEVEKDRLLYRYKCRKIGTFKWIQHNCLDTLLTVITKLESEHVN